MNGLPLIDPMDLDEGDFLLVHWTGQPLVMGKVVWLRGLPHVSVPKGAPRPLVGYLSAFLVTGLLAKD